MTTVFPIAGECFTRYQIQYDREMCKRLFETGDMLRCMRQVIVDHTWGIKDADITDGMIQAFQCAFTPNGTMAFDEHLISLCKMKVDIQFTCEDIEQWYDTAMADMFYDNTSIPAQWRYPRYVWTNFILPQIQENLMQIRWAGVRVDPTPGVAGNVIDACDGLCKHIQDGVDLGYTTPIATGPLVKGTVIDQIEAFIRDIPYPYCMQPGYKVLCSPSIKDCYVMEWRERYGMVTGCCDDNDNLSARIFNTPYMLEAVRELEGTDTLIFTSQNNLIVGRRRGEAFIPNINWETDKRNLCGMMEMHRLYGVRCWREFFINDQFKTVSTISNWQAANANRAANEKGLTVQAV